MLFLQPAVTDSLFFPKCERPNVKPIRGIIQQANYFIKTLYNLNQNYYLYIILLSTGFGIV
jgi:hypothetical protein